ncbi:MAG: hypothetical protein NTX45_26035 [Proteobacteria bacterium]|nr:hypothetical protein [Pseudomonadota bacterium]
MNYRNCKPQGFFILSITLLALCGVTTAMANEYLKLKWEWPAGRQIETKILANVQGIEKVSKGFFGIGDSPSLADSLPDAKDVVVAVISGSEALVGQTLTLRVPGMEADKLKVGGHAALGLINNNSVCVCVSVVPVKNPDEIKTWFNQWICQQPH